LENTGANPYRVQGTIHGPDYFAEKGITSTYEHSFKLSNSFYTYGIEWREDEITWLFNEKIYHQINRIELEKRNLNWVFNQEFFLLINLAVGGGFGGPVDPSLKKAELEVASIEYYSLDGVGEVIFYE
jgi:beta-glucanase (GH16 family)